MSWEHEVYCDRCQIRRTFLWTVKETKEVDIRKDKKIKEEGSGRHPVGTATSGGGAGPAPSAGWAVGGGAGTTTSGGWAGPVGGGAVDVVPPQKWGNKMVLSERGSSHRGRQGHASRGRSPVDGGPSDGSRHSSLRRSPTPRSRSGRDCGSGDRAPRSPPWAEVVRTSGDGRVPRSPPRREEFRLAFQPPLLNHALENFKVGEQVKDADRRCDQCGNAATMQYKYTPIMMCRSCWQMLHRLDKDMHKEFDALNNSFFERMEWR